MQSEARGSQPRNELARELLPAPVGPTMTILGSARTGFTRASPGLRLGSCWLFGLFRFAVASCFPYSLPTLLPLRTLPVPATASASQWPGRAMFTSPALQPRRARRERSPVSHTILACRTAYLRQVLAVCSQDSYVFHQLQHAYSVECTKYNQFSLLLTFLHECALGYSNVHGSLPILGM